MVAILAAAPLSLMAQTARPVPPGRVRVPNNPGDNRRATDQKPCWQQAGISKAAMEQRRAIQQSTREQIEAVCSQPGLTDKERREKIHEIRQAAQQKLAASVTTQQEAALKSCQESRAAKAPHPSTGNHAGPCGEMGH